MAGLGLAVWVLSASCAAPSADEPDPVSMEEPVELWSADVLRELSELEQKIGALRSASENSVEEDLTAEFVHLDQLMAELRERVERRRVSDEIELDRARAETRAALREIETAYANIVMQVTPEP